MAVRIEFHPGAESDIEQARRWYFERSPIAAHAFLLEIEHAIEQIARFPDRWTGYIANTRSFSLPRFPFRLVYIVGDEVAIIVAACHHRRKPGYWIARRGP